MLVFSALVAGSFSLGALSANEIDPSAFNALRFWIASLVVGSVLLLTTKVPTVAYTAIWRYGVLGALFAAYFVLMFEGLKTAPPVSTAAVFTLTPIMTAVFGYFLIRQILPRGALLGLLVGGIGALWVIFRADLSALLAFEIGRGEAIYFWGCLAHALYTPMIRKLNRGEPAIVFTFGVLIAGGVLLLIWAMPAILATDWRGLPQIVWITVLYTAVFASAATFVLLQFAVLRLPAAKVMAYTYLTPSWVILWEIALGNPAPSGLVVVGIGLTLLALLILLAPDAES